MMKKLVVGILAHVDAGKTTLSEGLLYRCGNIKKLGRVDHQDAFLDNNQLERQRGITIFSKQALLSDEEMEIINALFLCNPDELSEREIARRLGVPQKTLNCAKQRIFKKF